MFCIYCGNEVQENQEYCDKCGKPIQEESQKEDEILDIDKLAEKAASLFQDKKYMEATQIVEKIYQSGAKDYTEYLVICCLTCGRFEDARKYAQEVNLAMINLVEGFLYEAGQLGHTYDRSKAYECYDYARRSRELDEASIKIAESGCDRMWLGSKQYFTKVAKRIIFAVVSSGIIMLIASLAQ